MSAATMFAVTGECIRLGLRAGAVIFRNVRVTARAPELHAEIVREVEVIRSRYADAGAIRANPVVACFQELLRKVGVNPRKEQPSLERLLTFALKRGDLPAVNSLVDSYNLVSVRSSLSLGAHDLDRIVTPVSLRLLDGTESFTPLGGEEVVPVAAGEYGYVDAANRILCRLDILQADFSRVTTDTRNALLIVEGTEAHPPELLRQACVDAIAQVTRYCGGVGEVVAFPEEGTYSS